MKEPEAYRGREQTYLKHFFLERYLERVAYNIGWGRDFVYVDGFSGPWRSEDEAFEDTSFMIAINKLRAVRDTLAEQGKRPTIRCLFVEKDPKVFAELESATEDIKDIEVQVINGEFEAVLPEILAYVGSSFALTFIDPAGWTGFALKRIAPLLRGGGEPIRDPRDSVERRLSDRSRVPPQARDRCRQRDRQPRGRRRRRPLRRVASAPRSGGAAG